MKTTTLIVEPHNVNEMLWKLKSTNTTPVLVMKSISKKREIV